MHSPSPFETPQAPLDERGGEPPDGEVRRRTHMDYMAAYKSFFAQPRWGMSLLFLGIINLVPVLGTLVSQGFGLADNVRQHLTSDEVADEFTFDRFGEYLSRGVWLLIAGFLMMIPATGVWIVLFIPTALLGSLGETAGVLAGLLSFGLMLAMMVLLMLITQPLMLRVGLTQSLDGVFSIPYYRDFISKMWLEILLSSLFLAVTSIPLALISAIACGLPMLAVAGLMAYAQMHLMLQVYELYVERGGEPLEIGAAFSEG